MLIANPSTLAMCGAREFWPDLGLTGEAGGGLQVSEERYEMAGLENGVLI